ncbi:MAG: SUMF1/EgtB/PvdO family nonheme iron enzyme [Verrucomicrobiota bacterium]
MRRIKSYLLVVAGVSLASAFALKGLARNSETAQGQETVAEQPLEKTGETAGGGDAQAAAVSEVESGLGDNVALAEAIRAEILKNHPEKSVEDMEAYTSVVPKTGVEYEMLPIPGGEFMMGSPEDEEGREDDEGPQHKVKVSPFWMGKFEVTWDLYNPFMITSEARNKDGSPVTIEPDAENVEIVSSPTAPYTEMSFGMGTDGYPAICMTQHAALKFCQWLSAQTGHFYRLPTEAEWEFAARGGLTGPYSVPADEIEEYAVVDPDQSRVGYEQVGTKKPNPFGLYDIHGNVMEWVLDGYVEDVYASRSGVTVDPLVVPTSLYPRVVRGGSWYDPPDWSRSARRVFSEDWWKEQDPQLPRSIWYHTDADFVGFRLVRPLEVPDAETMNFLWNLGREGANGES